MKKLIIFTVILLQFVIHICYGQQPPHEKTQVLVVGTIHGNHADNPNYSYQDIVNILGTFNPDVICVEIPPSYFRKQSYLKEMMIASIFGFENNKQVYPIDWSPNIDPRAEQVKYMKTDDYKLKKQKADSLANSNIIMQNFIEKYGELDTIWNDNQLSYEFFNGKDYNDYIREMYTIVIKTHGDGCMNLYSEQRNAGMMALIDSAITKNRGKRVIVLTGAEHKYYFDISFSKRNDLMLSSLKDILPLKEIAMSKNISEFIEKNLARGYYDVSDASSIDVLYHGALIPLIHGLGMDDNPDIIPAENIKQTQPVISEWETYNPQSVALHFEKSWIKFLEKNYTDAITIAESVADRLNEIPEDSQWFYLPFFWRNLGFCYDMAGEREKAIKAYQQCKEVCTELNLNENFARTIYKNFESKPYNRDK
jgi:tetratricopeptide (TPR) repeat protein